MNINDLEIGKWAILDIETTGLNPLEDNIIDIGFIQYEGLKIIKKYSSLVYSDNVPPLITKLTGIHQSDLIDAPTLDEILDEISVLNDHKIIAHNSRFESSFLSQYFTDDTEFVDSIPFFALFFPFMPNFKLETFITQFKVRDSEVHRGYEDSIDLLKVLIISLLYTYEKIESNKKDFYKYLRTFLNSSMQYLKMHDDWFFNYFSISLESIYELAETIKFDIDKHLKILNDLYKSEEIEADTCSSKVIDYHFNGENIKNILRDNNEIKKILPNYLYREEQEKLSLRVGQSFKNNIHSLIQAPTGTGKTLGYLIPTFLFAKNEKKQVFIATATKTLQSQILNKDIKLTQKILGLSNDQVKVSYIIGANNHFCEMLYRKSYTDNQFDLFDTLEEELEKPLKLFVELIFFYNSFNSFNNQITRLDVPYVLKKVFSGYQDLEQNIKADYRSCTGFLCPYKKNCSYFNSMQEAKEAKVLIGNHALLFHLPRVLKWPSHIVIDESHKLESEVTSAFSLSFNQNNFSKFLNVLNKGQGLGALFYIMDNEGDYIQDKEKLKLISNEIYEFLQTINEKLTKLVHEFFESQKRFSSEYWNESKLIENYPSNEKTEILNFLGSIYQNLNRLFVPLEYYDLKWDLSYSKDENFLTAITKFKTFFGNLSDLMQTLSKLFAINESGGFSFKDVDQVTDISCSLLFHLEHGYSVELKPINCGNLTYEHVLDLSESVIMTSATLTSNNSNKNALEWFSGHCYLENSKRFKDPLIIEPIFDYKNVAKVFICDDTPKLYMDTFVDEIIDEILPLIKEIKGRSLLLFSAKKRFNKAVNVLLDRLDGELPLFVQGMNVNIVEEFKKSNSGILIGMESFSEGVDIPGESLQFLFIDKIPDLSYDLIIDDRRKFYNTKFGNEFVDYYLSNRTRQLHQKLGRLIRSESDFGASIIVDSRVKNWKSNTMNSFKSLMSPYEIERKTLKEACEMSKEFISRTSN
jgi:ATP-dependent DNA helicase DinG